ncbi:MAG: cyclopropane-fatty-acyl-phospholipid synthase family protein, partial [Pseudomonadota bacterium]|nr:cyclopropane-fatty-acyl-phospholipid synthase family protein [Pseudomonadota bacterium]
TLASLRDITVVGVTLSEEQYQHSRRRIDNAGLAERVRIHLQDYRQVQGHFDRIVSVGMLEHVGPRHYLEYYRKIAQLLTDNGVAVIHAIGKFHTPAPLNPWMAKYIFPGAYTPTLAEQTKAIEKAGLWVTDVEILRVHYADTLKAWRRRFQQNIDTARALYDDRFCRMWDFYLAGCEAAFRRGELMVFQIQLAKAVDTLPLTRDYMADYDIQTQPA